MKRRSVCAGIADCPIDRPFRCYDYRCVGSFSECSRHPRTYRATTLLLTVNPLKHETIDIIVEDNQVLGTAYVPSNIHSLPTTSTLDGETTTTSHK